MRGFDTYCAQAQRRFWDVALECLIAQARQVDHAVACLMGVKAGDAESQYFVWTGVTCAECAGRSGQIFRRGVDAEPPLHPRCRCSTLPYRGEVPDEELSPLSYINRNAGIFRRPNGMPESWVPMRSKDGEGIRYRDPENVHNEVRIQKGSPDVSNLWQQTNYVKWKRSGQWMDADGNIIINTDPGRSYEAHIPIENFIFDLRLFK